MAETVRETVIIESESIGWPKIQDASLWWPGMTSKVYSVYSSTSYSCLWWAVHVSSSSMCALISGT